MYFNDYHIHSEFSGDSVEKLENIFNKAIDLSIKEIAITDHLEYDVIGMTDIWKLDLDRYVKTLLEYKELYKNKLDIKVGVEVGAQPHTKDYLEDVLRKYPFDFIIISSHAIDKHDIGMGHLHKTMDKSEIQKYYFETVLKNVKLYKHFSVYGHLDFVTRYGGPLYRGLNLRENQDLIDEILKLLISKDKGLEINTSGFRYKENRFYPCDEILKRYIQLGGEIITIGSDSHIKDHLTMDFKLVYDFLKENGINYICSFNQMKPEFIKI